MIFPLDEYYVIFDRYSQKQGINHIMENIVCYEKVIIPKGCSFLARYDQEATIDTLELHAHDEVEFQFTLSGYGIRNTVSSFPKNWSLHNLQHFRNSVT